MVIWHRDTAQEAVHICVMIEGISFWESQKAEIDWLNMWKQNSEKSKEKMKKRIMKKFYFLISFVKKKNNPKIFSGI